GIVANGSEAPIAIDRSPLEWSCLHEWTGGIVSTVPDRTLAERVFVLPSVLARSEGASPQPEARSRSCGLQYSSEASLSSTELPGVHPRRAKKTEPVVSEDGHGVRRHWLAFVKVPSRLVRWRPARPAPATWSSSMSALGLFLFGLITPAQEPARQEQEVPVTIKELDLGEAMREFQAFQQRLGEFREQIGEGRKLAKETAQILEDLRQKASAENDYNEGPILDAV